MIQDFTARLTDKQQLNQSEHSVWRLTFALQDDMTFAYEPGQYVILRVGNNFRQYSISSPPSDAVNEKRSFELIVEMIDGGVGSEFFKQLNIGGEAQFKGPAGVFILRNTPKEKIFLATGTGIAPIKSMIMTHVQENRPENVYLFFGLKNKQEAYLHDDFESIRQKHSNFQYTMCLSRDEGANAYGTCFLYGHVNDGLERLWDQSPQRDYEYYVCGSKGAVDSIKQYLIDKGIPPESIYFERFTL